MSCVFNSLSYFVKDNSNDIRQKYVIILSKTNH